MSKHNHRPKPSAGTRLTARQRALKKRASPSGQRRRERRLFLQKVESEVTS